MFPCTWWLHWPGLWQGTANHSISLAQFDYTVEFEEEYREAIASGHIITFSQYSVKAPSTLLYMPYFWCPTSHMKYAAFKMMNENMHHTFIQMNVVDTKFMYNCSILHYLRLSSPTTRRHLALAIYCCVELKNCVHKCHHTNLSWPDNIKFFLFT